MTNAINIEALNNDIFYHINFSDEANSNREIKTFLNKKMFVITGDSVWNRLHEKDYYTSWIVPVKQLLMRALMIL